MKKILMIVLFLIGIFSYGNNYLENLENFEKEMIYKKHIDLYGVDYNYADFFIINTKLAKEISNEFLIILPNVQILERNKDKISKFGKDVIVFLLDRKSEILKGRSIEELKDKKFANNVRIVTVRVNSEIEEKIIKDTENDKLYFKQYFKDIFYKKYKEITRYDYLEVLNK